MFVCPMCINTCENYYSLYFAGSCNEWKVFLRISESYCLPLPVPYMWAYQHFPAGASIVFVST